MKSRWLWVVPIVVGIALALLGFGASSSGASGQTGGTQRSTLAASTPTVTPAASIKWKVLGGGEDGYAADSYKFAVGVSKIDIQTKPTSATDTAIPSGKARMSIHLAIQSRTAGAGTVNPTFYVGVPKDSSWQYMSPEDAARLHLLTSGCENGGPVGKPDYCWNTVEIYPDSTSGSESSVPLSGSQTVDTVLSNTGYGGDLVSASLKPSDVIVALSDLTNPSTAEVLPWP